jgi:hypothetical protein
LNRSDNFFGAKIQTEQKKSKKLKTNHEIHRGPCLHT